MLATFLKHLDHVKLSATDALKTTPKNVIPERAEATGDLIGYKITNKITKNLPQNNSETNSFIVIQMLKSSLCYYSDAYITFTGAISVANT